MSRIITKNRDPRLNEFGPNDLVLNTTTGDLFLKSQNQLFKVIGRNQFDQSTTDKILQLLDDATEKVETDEGTGLNEIITGFSQEVGVGVGGGIVPTVGVGVGVGVELVCGVGCGVEPMAAEIVGVGGGS